MSFNYEQMIYICCKPFNEKKIQNKEGAEMGGFQQENPRVSVSGIFPQVESQN